MKGRSNRKNIKNLDCSEVEDAYDRTSSARTPIDEIRPHVVENAARLIAQPGYPPKKVVNRLAELFASAFIAERN